jgi:two-component system chemotaxis response regulator CheB
MAEHAVPIIVITEKGIANYAFAAISKGALEIIPKADVNMERPSDLVNKLKLLSKVKVITHLSGNKRRKKGIQKAGGKREMPERVVAIASSTGGPKALSAILPELPKKFPYPVVIAQHMANGFISGLVEWLNGISKIPVREGADGEMTMGGTVYISPSEKHMKINSGRRISLIEKQPSDIYHPSCNLLLSSAADVFGANSIGIILTGMGNDGVSGVKKIKEIGGITIAQDEKTSAIFGMPKVAIESGCIDKVLPLNEIGKEIVRQAMSNEQ